VRLVLMINAKTINEPDRADATLAEATILCGLGLACPDDSILGRGSER
jgi:hypothetical protein